MFITIVFIIDIFIFFNRGFMTGINAVGLANRGVFSLDFDDAGNNREKIEKRKLAALNISPTKTVSKTRKISEIKFKKINTNEFIKTHLNHLLQQNSTSLVIDYLKTMEEDLPEMLPKCAIYVLNQAVIKNDRAAFNNIMYNLMNLKISFFDSLKFQKFLRDIYNIPISKEMNDYTIVLADPNNPTYELRKNCSESILQLNIPNLNLAHRGMVIQAKNFEKCTTVFIKTMKMLYGYHEGVNTADDYRSLFEMAFKLGAEGLIKRMLQNLPSNLKNQHFVWMELFFKYGKSSDFSMFKGHQMPGFENFVEEKLYSLQHYLDDSYPDQPFYALTEVEKWVSVYSAFNQMHQLPTALLNLNEIYPNQFKFTDYCYNVFLTRFNDSHGDMHVRIGDHLIILSQQILSWSKPELIGYMESLRNQGDNVKEVDDGYYEYNLSELLINKNIAKPFLKLCYCSYSKMNYHAQLDIEDRLDVLSIEESSRFKELIEHFNLCSGLIERLGFCPPEFFASTNEDDSSPDISGQDNGHNLNQSVDLFAEDVPDSQE